jgi:hypothetical protein
MKSPYDQFNEPVVPTETTERTPWVWVLVVLLAGGLLFSVVNNKQPNNNDIIDYIDDDVVPPDDSEDEVIKVDLADSYVIRVYETEAYLQTPSMIKVLNDDSFWLNWFEEKKIRYFSFDPSSNPEQVESFIIAAKKHNVEPPFIMYGKDSKMLFVIPFDESVTTDKIKEMILSKGK